MKVFLFLVSLLDSALGLRLAAELAVVLVVRVSLALSKT